MKRLPSLAVAACVVCSASAASAQNSIPLELQNQYSGKCLAVKGASTAHGAPLEHKACGTRNTETIWEFTAVTPGVYRIANKRSGKCLGVERQSKSDGAVVTQVNACDQRPDTTWQVEALNLGAPLVIKNRNSQKCLALVTGSQVKQYGCGGNAEHVAKTTWRLLEPRTVATGFKRVFVTEAAFQADFLKGAPWEQVRRPSDGGLNLLSTVDKICQNAADASQLSGTYLAWLSLYDPRRCEGMRVTPLANNDSAPYVNVCADGYRPVANNFADLLDGSLDNPISCTEKGRQFQGTPGVWTGTRTDGRPAHYDACRRWRTSHGSECYLSDCCFNYFLAADFVRSGAFFTGAYCLEQRPVVASGYQEWSPVRSLVGNAGAKDKNWTQYRWLSCKEEHKFRLYCFEQ